MTADMMIFYVRDVAESATFYTKVFGQEPNDHSPAFALFALPTGLKFGLWKNEAVAPSASHQGCGAELVIHVDKSSAVDAAHETWQAASVAVLDPPTAREFGYSVVAADPDGHRVRVMKAGG